MGLFRDRLAIQRARTLPMPRHPKARAAATNFLRHMNEPPEGDLDSTALQAFRHELGMTFTSWRHTARMQVASGLLANGAKVSNVAQEVGYTQVSNFGRAFSHFYGLSPRAYQTHERNKSN